MRHNFSRFVILIALFFPALPFAAQKNPSGLSPAPGGAPAAVLNGTVIRAGSCSRADVQAAINQAGDGDTVLVPAGSASWTSPVSIAAKAIVLRGAGIGQTVITDSGSSGLVLVEGLEGKPFRLSGFRFILGSAPTIHVTGTCKTWRIDNFLFENPVGHPLVVAVQSGGLNDTGYTHGVVDHCSFKDCMVLVIEGIGHDSWKRPLDLGTEKATYVEDCDFLGAALFGHAIDANHGGRYVFRHNTVTNYYIEAHSLQNQDSQNIARATRKIEVYDNRLTAVANGSPGVFVGIAIRAGSGVIFNNTINNASGDPYNYLIGIDNVRSFEHLGGLLGDADGGNPLDGNEPVDNGTGSHTGISNQSMLTCSGKTWAANAYVGNWVYNLTDGSKGRITANTASSVTAALSGGTERDWDTGDGFKISNGYPALDQIGRSTDHGPGTDRLPQALEPLYCWNNTMDGVIQGATVINGCAKHIRLNRDYYHVAKPGYSPYPYPHPLTKMLHLVSPNGDETWAAGSRQAITWMFSDYDGPLAISLQRNGSKVMDLGTAQAGALSYSWTLPLGLAASDGYTVKIVGGANEDVSDAPFSVVSSPIMNLSQNTLNFGAASGLKTSSQKVYLRNAGNGIMSWSASTNRSWLSVSPASGTGNAWLTVSVNPAGLGANTYSGSISITAPSDPASPQQIATVLRVTSAGSPPYGAFDSPANNASGIAGCIALSGWALDDLEVTGVKIFRNPQAGEPTQANGLVFLGDALFIEGARPDVETAYSGSPLNYRAGWGLMTLTNCLPNQGNGVFTMTAVATDREGHTITLGNKTLTVDNAHATKPFGTIDTPVQGGTVTASPCLSFGWALTPLPGLIPFDGSTIWVYIDGAPIGHPSYNHYRQDIASVFPNFSNSLGAVGVYSLETTGLAEGLHTIAWGVTDSLGRTGGIGSRYFSVLHSSSLAAERNRESIDVPLGAAQFWVTTPVRIRRGFERAAESVFPDPDRRSWTVDLKSGEPLAIELDPGGYWPLSRHPKTAASSFSGYQIVGNRIRPLPVGSRFDSQAGVFTWLPGAGFAGAFQLEFFRVAEDQTVLRWRIDVDIDPGREASRRASRRSAPAKR